MQCTEKYFEADAFRTRAESVLLAAVPDSRTGGGLLALEGTVFYPEGGGQPADRGTLTLPDGTELAVTDVHEQDGILWHSVPSLPDTAVPGITVEETIDWDWRFDKMQQHTGEHILSGILHRMFGAENVGFHIFSYSISLYTLIQHFRIYLASPIIILPPPLISFHILITPPTTSFYFITLPPFSPPFLPPNYPPTLTSYISIIPPPPSPPFPFLPLTPHIPLSHPLSLSSSPLYPLSFPHSYPFPSSPSFFPPFPSPLPLLPPPLPPFPTHLYTLLYPFHPNTPTSYPPNNFTPFLSYSLFSAIPTLHYPFSFPFFPSPFLLSHLPLPPPYISSPSPPFPFPP